jgi:putative ABC transport system substrate-binding protein
MNRRSFVFGGLATALFSHVQAQSPEPPLVMLIGAGPAARSASQKDSFLRGMREAGQAEGRTFRFETRYADGDTKRYAQMIRDAAAERPAVLVVTGLLGARAARDATSKTPVVLATGSDMVDAGIARSYARPGGNITGVSDLTDESAAKRLELLKAALPDATRVALLVNTEFPATPKVERRVADTAKSLGIEIRRLPMHDRASMLAAVDMLREARTDALLVAETPSRRRSGAN